MKYPLIILLTCLMLLALYINNLYTKFYNYNKGINSLKKDFSQSFDLAGLGKENITYVALGDSLTFGLGASKLETTLPYLIGENISSDYKKVRVINLAIPGVRSEHLLEQQLPRALSEKPALVTIFIGTNDVHDFVPIKTFKTNLEKTIENLKKENVKVVLINIPYLGTKDLLQFPISNFLDYQIKRYNKELNNLATLYQIPLIDLYSLSKLELKEEDYSVDQFHPNDQGYLLWGELINANHNF